MTESTIYQIPAESMDALREAIVQMNIRAEKLGCAAVVLTIHGETTKKIVHAYGTFEHKLVLVSVDGTAPSLEGWSMVAVKEPLETGEYLLRVVPGRSCPAEFRSTGMHCVHCGTDRRRSEVFVVRHEDGSCKQVGRQCLKDFLGGKDPTAILAGFEMIQEVSAILGDFEGDSEGGAGRAPLAVGIDRYLSVVACCIRRLGWAAKSKAYETGAVATASLAFGVCIRPDRRLIADNELYVSEADSALADSALEWAVTQGGSDYLDNLAVACRRDIVDHRTAGLVASAISAYQRAQGIERERERKKASSHIGAVGKRESFDVRVVAIRTFDSQWGARSMVQFEDMAGNVLVWWTGETKLSEGWSGRIKGTVKEHTEYRGAPQTVLSRVSA